MHALCLAAAWLIRTMAYSPRKCSGNTTGQKRCKNAGVPDGKQAIAEDRRSRGGSVYVVLLSESPAACTVPDDAFRWRRLLGGAATSQGYSRIAPTEQG